MKDRILNIFKGHRIFYRIIIFLDKMSMEFTRIKIRLYLILMVHHSDAFPTEFNKNKICTFYFEKSCFYANTSNLICTKYS